MKLSYDIIYKYNLQILYREYNSKCNIKMSSHCSHNSRRSKNTTINVGVTPNGIAITDDNNFAYVANNNNYSLQGQHTVTVIDLKTNLPYKTIKHESFNGPYTVTIYGKLAFVTNSGGSTISAICTKTNKVVKVIDGFDGPSGMTIQGHFAYINNYGATPGAGSGNAKTVSVLNLKTYEITDVIEVGLAPAAIVSDHKHVYTINYTDGNPNTGTISKISIKDLSVSTIGPFTKDGLSGPFGIALSGHRAVITNFGSNNFTPFGTTVSVVNLRKGSVEKTIDVGVQPSGVALFGQGRYAIISNYNTLYAYITSNPVTYNNLTAGQGTVNIIDLHEGKVLSTHEVGQSPANIAVDKSERYAYVTCYTGGTVSVVKL